MNNQFLILLKKYGHPKGQWKLWCKRRKNIAEKEEVIISAILTQNTNWKNVKKAIEQLKNKKMCNFVAIQKNKNLEQIIRPAGFYKTKNQYLKNTADFFNTHGGVTTLSKWPLQKLRASLLQVHGIGPETADSILLYALNKPSFVIDEYTRRFTKKLKVTQKFTYSALQKYFTNKLPKNTKLYQDFHALIVIDGIFIAASARRERESRANIWIYQCERGLSLLNSRPAFKSNLYKKIS